jgi:hypothetical protein
MISKKEIRKDIQNRICPYRHAPLAIAAFPRLRSSKLYWTLAPLYSLIYIQYTTTLTDLSISQYPDEELGLLLNKYASFQLGL